MDCFTAAIINLGVKGHLRIVENDDKTTLEQARRQAAIAPEEEALMAKLFAGRTSMLLDQTNHDPIGNAKTGLGGDADKELSRQAVHQQLRLVRRRLRVAAC